MGKPLGLGCDMHSLGEQHLSLLSVCGICDLLLPQICFCIVSKTLVRTSQISRLHICNSNLARSMVSVITLFVIPRFEFHNECVQEEGDKKLERFLTPLKINVFQQPSAPLWRERAFTRIWRPLSAAKGLIITSLKVLKKNDYRRQYHWQPLLPSREKELIWSWWHQSLSSPFSGQQQLGLEEQEMGWILRIVRRWGWKMTRRVVITSPFWDWEGFLNCLDCAPAFVHSYIDPQSGKWALGQCEALELEQE